MTPEEISKMAVNVAEGTTPYIYDEIYQALLTVQKQTREEMKKEILKAVELCKIDRNRKEYLYDISDDDWDDCVNECLESIRESGEK